MIWLVSIAFIVSLAWLARLFTSLRVQARRNEYHDQLVNAVTSWLIDKRVVHALIQSGSATAEGLVSMGRQAGRMPEPMLRAAVMALLRDRWVRQEVAKHMERRGAKRARAMGELLRMSKGERP